MERRILHSDMNNFYASVECLYDESLRGKAIAVAGDPESRHGIVLAKSEEAKKCGVKTAEPLWQAKQKCPHILFVPPHYDRYYEYSDKARRIYEQYTDQVEPFGLDECWLDVTGSQKLLGSAPEIAERIRAQIKADLGLTVSIGVSFNKIFAKLGSDLRKPDKVTVILQEDVARLVWPLPVRDLLYVGAATAEKLGLLGIRSIGDLARADSALLQRQLGKNGLTLWNFANGRDASPVAPAQQQSLPKSISNSTTTPRDLITEEDLKTTLLILAESVSARLRERDLVCQTVQLGVRDADLRWSARQAKLEIANRTAEALYTTCWQLYQQHYQLGRPVRGLSVQAGDLLRTDYQQLTLFDDTAQIEKREQLESVIDGLRQKFGKEAVQRGRILADPQLGAISPKDDHLYENVKSQK